MGFTLNSSNNNKILTQCFTSHCCISLPFLASFSSAFLLLSRLHYSQIPQICHIQITVMRSTSMVLCEYHIQSAHPLEEPQILHMQNPTPLSHSDTLTSISQWCLLPHNLWSQKCGLYLQLLLCPYLLHLLSLQVLFLLASPSYCRPILFISLIILEPNPYPTLQNMYSVLRSLQWVPPLPPGQSPTSYHVLAGVCAPVSAHHSSLPPLHAFASTSLLCGAAISLGVTQGPFPLHPLYVLFLLFVHPSVQSLFLINLCSFFRSQFRCHF